jgi:hypothetical protein
VVGGKAGGMSAQISYSTPLTLLAVQCKVLGPRRLFVDRIDSSHTRHELSVTPHVG